MTTTKELLERSRDRIDGPELRLETVYGRRDGRHARRRVAAAAVAIVITVGGVAMFARSLDRTDQQPGGDEISAPVADATGWVDIPAFRAPYLNLRAVAGNSAGFVAVGDTSRGDATDPVWFSPDGFGWSRAPEGPDSPNLWDVLAFRIDHLDDPAVVERFVAAGVGPQDGPAAWTSENGRTWTRAAVELPADPGGHDAMFGLFPTGAGVVAWGTLGNAPAIWWSQEGTSWELVSTGPAFDATAEGQIVEVAQTADGFVAIGWERPRGEGEHEQVWTSADGTTWVRGPRLTKDELTAW
jgi:hypothetical protein